MGRFAKYNVLTGMAICAAAFLTVIQTVNFPFVPFTDAICFLPQAVKFAQGDGLRNVYQFAYLPDGAYVWHGFLFPLVLGGVFGTDTYIKVTLALAVLNALNIVLLGYALVRLTSDWKPGLSLVFVMVCLLAQVGFLQGILGRPETLSSLLFSCGLLLWTFRPSLVVYGLIGVVIGMLAVTSPLPAVYAGGFAFIGILTRETRPSALLGSAAVVGAAALLAVTLAFCFYPYTLGQWLWGMEQHAKNVIKDHGAGTTLAAIMRQFFISSGRLMMGPVFAGSLAAAGYIVWQARGGRRRYGLALLALVLLLGFVVFRVSFEKQFYYLLCIFPVAAGLAAKLLGMANSLLSLTLKTVVFAALALSALDPLLLQAGRIFGYSGMPLPEARRLFAEDIKKMPGKVALSMDLAVLSDTTDRLKVLYSYVPPCEEPDADWLVAQQFCYFYDTPPTYENFTLVQDRFVDRKKRPGRLSQWFGVNGYGYAVYRRKGTAD